MPPASRRIRSPLLLGLVTLVELGLAALPAHAELTAGTVHARSLEYGGITRVYEVYAPPGYDGVTAVPLVVDLHKENSWNDHQQGGSGWWEKASREGFVVAWPQGTGRSWNAVVCCDPARANGVDDVGFIRAMVAAISAEAPIDTERIYATGTSNGGELTHRLACEAADLFAAAAPLAFPTPYPDFETDCQPSRRIPVLVSMGRTDFVVPYFGDPYDSAAESLANWRAKNACGPEPLETHFELGRSWCDADPSCADGVHVGLCTIYGRGFVGGNADQSGHWLYSNYDDIVMADLIWSFFAQDGEYFAVPEPGPAALASTALATLAWLVGGRSRRRR